MSLVVLLDVDLARFLMSLLMFVVQSIAQKDQLQYVAKFHFLLVMMHFVKSMKAIYV